MLDPITSDAYREAIREWRGKLVWQTLVASLALLTVFAAAVALSLSGAIPLWLGGIATFVAIHAGFTILHEACHRAISGDAPGLGWLDPLLGTFHAALLLYDYPTFKYLHLRHHSHTNDPTLDPDYWLQRYSVPVMSVLSFFVPLHYLRLYLRAGAAGQISRLAVILTLVRVVLLIGILLTALILAPVETFMLWLAPASIASMLISISHRMLHEAEVSTDRRQTTRIVKGEAFWEWLICPLFWLNNHHLLHHESPRLPAVSHPRLFSRVEQSLAANGAHIVRLGAKRHD